MIMYDSTNVEADLRMSTMLKDYRATINNLCLRCTPLTGSMIMYDSTNVEANMRMAQCLKTTEQQ